MDCICVFITGFRSMTRSLSHCRLHRRSGEERKYPWLPLNFVDNQAKKKWTPFLYLCTRMATHTWMAKQGPDRTPRHGNIFPAQTAANKWCMTFNMGLAGMIPKRCLITLEGRAIVVLVKKWSPDQCRPFHHRPHLRVQCKREASWFVYLINCQATSGSNFIIMRSCVFA